MKTTIIKKIFFSTALILSSFSEQHAANKQLQELPEVKFLNMFLESRPVMTLKLKSSHSTAKKTLQSIYELEQNSVDQQKKQESENNGKTTKERYSGTKKNDQKNHNREQSEIDKNANAKELALIIELRDALLKPVNQFFEPLYEHRSLLEPLIKALLLEGFKNQGTKEKDLDNMKFMSLEFLKTSPEKAATFFHDNLVTKEMIIKTCEEFAILFGVITDNLSEEAKIKSDELYQKIQKKHSKK